ncbi:MAG TPA: Ig-like domain-containing protein, partial [Gaiellaceae bacterium]|nr:Ig-like domain-containing protein [Gaiellaceae bacterium]
MVVLLAVLVAAAAGSARASGKNGRVAILSTSIANDVISPGPAQAFESLEAYEARSLGFAVDLIKPAEWALMTTADFANYNAVVIGDPKCNNGDLSPAVNSAAVWGPAVDGNVAVLGNAPVTTYWLNHDLSSRVGSGFEVLGALKFATADSSKTGAYLDVGCAAKNAPADSPVSLLDGIAGTGAFKATGSNGACWNAGHIVDTSGALATLTDAFLSNWPCNALSASALEVFTQYPADFRPYATANGSPYILLRGGAAAASNSITLGPPVGSNRIGEQHTVDALVTEGGAPVVNTHVYFFLTDGSPNVGLVSGDVLTGADGVASLTYDDVSGLPGTDTIQASYADSGGVVRDSNTVTETWTVAPAPDATAPTISITSPADGASYTLNQTVTASYSCADEAGGSGIATCTGPVAPGAAISTSTAGPHTFTVTATDNAGNPSSATSNYTVLPDTTKPTVTITTPAQGASYAQNAVVNATYSCTDDTSIPTCVGDVANGAPINTATLGNHTFTVTATDAAGNVGTAVHDYVVVDRTGPSVTITRPAEGESFTLNQAVTASFSCADEAGGSGLATCIGTVANGAALSTSAAGPHTFTVTAIDNAGNTSSETRHYTVLPDTTLPTISIVSPADGATFTLGQVVNASYSCADTGGSGLATCAGPVATGAAIDTASAGMKSFTVTATDHAGNTSSKIARYTVVVPPSTGSFTVKGDGKVGKDFKFQIDAKTGTKKPSGEVDIDVKGHSLDGTVTAITITGSTAVLTGTGLDNGKRVTFTVTVTDGGNKGKDTIAVTFGTYTGGGTVTDGQIRIRAAGNDNNRRNDN